MSSVPESSYPPLEKPEFKSQIPDHLMADASKAEQHIIAQLNILTQFADWSVRAHMATNEQVRKTNGRLIQAESDISTLEGDKKTVLTGWKMLAAIGAGIAGVLAFIATLVQLFGASSQ